MKQKVLLALLCAINMWVVNAQDVILKTNGDEVQAKVQEIGNNEVKYKKADGSGPVYAIPKSEVFMITYENGSKDVFGRGQKTADASTPAPAADPVSVSQVLTATNLPPASKTYKVGDIYNENGVKGIVVKATDGGRHGLIMSLNVSTDKWLKDKDAKFGTAAFYEDDGARNMIAIEQFINSGNASWDDFPVFQWARNLGNGWYIPAKEELVIIAEAVNGSKGISQTYNAKTVKAFSKKIKNAKGKSLLAEGFGQSGSFREMYSSTEAEGGLIYKLMLAENVGSALIGNVVKTSKKGKLNIQYGSKTIFTGGNFIGMTGSRAVYKF